MNEILDTVALVLVLIGGLLCVTAAIGLLRFHDVPTRLHAATKPQIFGLLLIIAAVALSERSFMTLLALLPVFVFQSLTAPVAAHMVGRAAYRASQLDTDSLVLDELAPAIERSDRE